jgi:hypothetical protein
MYHRVPNLVSNSHIKSVQDPLHVMHDRFKYYIVPEISKHTVLDTSIFSDFFNTIKELVVYIGKLIYNFVNSAFFKRLLFFFFFFLVFYFLYIVSNTL